VKEIPVELPIAQPYFNVVDLKNAWNTTTIQKLMDYNQLVGKIQYELSDTSKLSYGRVLTDNFERVLRLQLGTRDFGFAIGSITSAYKLLFCKNFKMASKEKLEALFPKDGKKYCIIYVYDPKCNLGLVQGELGQTF
jgi:hypothetical protein